MVEYNIITGINIFGHVNITEIGHMNLGYVQLDCIIGWFSRELAHSSLSEHSVRTIV